MYVILVGTGQVAVAVARRLYAEGCTLAVIDRDAARLEQLAVEVDAYCLQGSGAAPSLLQEAGVGRAAGVLALSDDEELNLLAGSIALALGAPQALVRVENPAYFDRGRLDGRLHPAFSPRLVPLPSLALLARALLWRALHGEAAEAYALLGGRLYLSRLRPGYPHPPGVRPLPIEDWLLLPGTNPTRRQRLIALGRPELLEALVRAWLPRPLRGLTLITSTRGGALRLVEQLPEAEVLGGPPAEVLQDLPLVYHQGLPVVAADPSPGVNLHFLKTLSRARPIHGVALADHDEAALFREEGFLPVEREGPLLEALFRHLLPRLYRTATLAHAEVWQGPMPHRPDRRRRARLPAGVLPLARERQRQPGRTEILPAPEALEPGDRVALWLPPGSWREGVLSL